MVDIDAKVRALVASGATQGEIIRELEAIANAAEKRAKKEQRQGAQDERAIVDEAGRHLFFLKTGKPADSSTQANLLLYELLKSVPK